MDAVGDELDLEVAHLVEQGAEEDVGVLRRSVDGFPRVEVDGVPLLLVMELEDARRPFEEPRADVLGDVAPGIHAHDAELSQPSLLVHGELANRAEAVDDETAADPTAMELLEDRPLDPHLACVDRLAADVGDDELEIRLLEVVLDLPRVGDRRALLALAAGGHLLEAALEDLLSAGGVEELPVVDGVGDVLLEGGMSVVEHDAREEIDELEVSQELVPRQLASRQSVVSVVVVMGDVNVPVVRVTLLRDRLHEAPRQPRVPVEAPAVLRGISSLRRQPVVRREVTRELLKDVVPEGAEDADGEHADVVLAGEARGAPDDPEDLILVAVADPRHGEAGVSAAPVERQRLGVIQYQGHVAAP